MKWVTTRHDGRLVRQLITGDEQGEIKLWDLEGDEQHSGGDQHKEPEEEGSEGNDPWYFYIKLLESDFHAMDWWIVT